LVLIDAPLVALACPPSGVRIVPESRTAGLSSGGFSNRWAMPSWQQAAVAAYLENGKGIPAPSVGYNKTGRAYPDIAAQVP